ncbi:MAG: biopolymer transporter ExbD [Chitinophagales bacterium]|nr:biopolymer transporter ExbD [Chitinophagales bacterium]
MASSRKKGSTEINASSMADIAFLLLIFFLVTTTIDQDKGILHKLPPWSDLPPPDVKLRERNVLEILVNANNQLLVEVDYIEISELKDIAIKHLDNRGKLENYSTSPQDAIISLKNDRGTNYGTYIQIQNELKAAYAELRDNMALKLTNGAMTYAELDDCSDNVDLSESKKSYCKTLKDQIQDEYPMKISEAEPVNLGGK